MHAVNEILAGQQDQLYTTERELWLHHYRYVAFFQTSYV
jgi:hypothetical protein